MKAACAKTQPELHNRTTKINILTFIVSLVTGQKRLISSLVRLDGVNELAPEFVDGQLLAVLEDGRVARQGSLRAGVLLARDRVHPIPGSPDDTMVRRGRRRHVSYFQKRFAEAIK